MNLQHTHRLLLTGGTGFVGRALLEVLANDAHFETRCSVRRDVYLNSAIQSVRVGNLDAHTDWSAALIGMHSVVHLAARVHVMNETAHDPLEEFRRVNVEGTLALARQAAAAGVRRFVFLSSIKVNGETGTFSERDAPNPRDAYGVSKLEAERGLQAVGAATGMQIVVIRPPLVYGHGVRANFRALIRLVERGVPLPLGAVRNQRSFVAVQNLASCIRTCVTHPDAADQTFLVSDGHDLSTTELLQRMARALGKPSRLIPVPPAILEFCAALIGRQAVAQRLLGSLQLDITKARELLGWTPAMSVDEALRATV
ncbi:MAG: SDR family oxidoreductase, partial [Gemmatimonadaceae bacterium]